MKKTITLKDIEDYLIENIFKKEDDGYLYDINSNIIKVKTKRSKKK